MNYHNWTKTNKLQAPCFKTKKQIEGASGPIKHCELSACRGKNNKLKSKVFHKTMTSSSFIHCLAALDFGAGVEQPFGCLIVQNRQAVQSVGRLMDWTLISLYLSNN